MNQRGALRCARTQCSVKLYNTCVARARRSCLIIGLEVWGATPTCGPSSTHYCLQTNYRTQIRSYTCANMLAHADYSTPSHTWTHLPAARAYRLMSVRTASLRSRAYSSTPSWSVDHTRCSRWFLCLRIGRVVVVCAWFEPPRQGPGSWYVRVCWF